MHIIPLILTGSVASYEDIKNRKISHVTIMGGISAGLATSAYGKNLGSALIGSILMAAPLYVIAYIYLLLTGNQGLGGGDIKMAFAYGLYLKEYRLIFFAYFITFALAGIFALIKKCKKVKVENSSLPLMPFMAIGTIVVYVLDSNIQKGGVG